MPIPFSVTQRGAGCIDPGYTESRQGGGKIEVRNFSQFSAISQFFAIFRNFSQFSAIFRNFSAIFHTSRFSYCLPTLVQNNENFCFLLFHTLSNVAKSPEPGIAQLVVALHCNSGVLGSNPVGHNIVTFAFLVFLPSLFWSFSCLHVCMFACACRPQDSLLRVPPSGGTLSVSHRHMYPLNPSPLLRLCLFLFFFYTSNMASASETPPPSEEVAECGSLKRKRGAGRGGAGAKYCSMSPWQRKEQFPDEPFEVRISDNNEEYLFCTCCGKPVSHQQKTFVQSPGAPASTQNVEASGAKTCRTS